MPKYTLANAKTRTAAHEAIDTAPNDYTVEIMDGTRSVDQNAVQWPILQAWAIQKQWPINGVMVYMTKEDWKDVLTAAFEGDAQPRIAPGFNNDAMVMLGRRTSKYGKKRFGEWLDWLLAASHHAGIKLPAPEQ